MSQSPINMPLRLISDCGGRLVFSTHHPTHDAKSLLEPGYLIEEIIEERWGWLGEQMRYYRRPLSSLAEPMASAGFLIERLVGPRLNNALQRAAPNGCEQLRRLPAFIFMRARKASADETGRYRGSDWCNALISPV
jgi:hypothetical protein